MSERPRDEADQPATDPTDDALDDPALDDPDLDDPALNDDAELRDEFGDLDAMLVDAKRAKGRVGRVIAQRDVEQAAQEEKNEAGYVMREYRRVMYQFSFIGIEFGVALVIGYFLGNWADQRLDTAPWLMLCGVALGFTAAGMDLVRLVRKAKRHAPAADADDGQSAQSPSAESADEARASDGDTAAGD